MLPTPCWTFSGRWGFNIEDHPHPQQKRFVCHKGQGLYTVKLGLECHKSRGSYTMLSVKVPLFYRRARDFYAIQLLILDGPIHANRFADSRKSPDSRESPEDSGTAPPIFKKTLVTPAPHIQGKNMNKHLDQIRPQMLQNKANSALWGPYFGSYFCRGCGGWGRKKSPHIL